MSWFVSPECLTLLKSLLQGNVLAFVVLVLRATAERCTFVHAIGVVYKEGCTLVSVNKGDVVRVQDLLGS